MYFYFVMYLFLNMYSIYIVLLIFYVYCCMDMEKKYNVYNIFELGL